MPGHKRNRRSFMADRNTGYRRRWARWAVIYVAVAAVVYLIVYLLVFHHGGGAGGGGGGLY
jgi:hypothetical protein